MLKIENNDYHTNFEKNILKNGKCQLIIRQLDCFEWMLDETFDNEEQADNFLNENWDYFCKISEDIWFTGLHAMQKTFKRYKDTYLD